MSDFNIQFEENDQHITLDFKEAIGTVQSVNGKIGDVVLDPGDLEYDDTETYSSGSVGDELSTLKDDFDDLDDRVTALEEGSSGSGLTEDIKQALLQIAEKVVYVDAHGQDYYNDLYDALYAITAITIDAQSIMLTSIGSTQQLTATTIPEGGSVTWASSNTSVATVSSTGLVTSTGYGSCTVTASSGSVSASCAVAVSQATLTSITADYQQSGTVYDTASLDSLKSDLTVTATYSDSSTATVTEYTLSGTLTAGTSTVTVSYGGKTTTFNVTVTAAPTLSSISAVYTQSGTVYDTDTLDSLKSDLVVTAIYSDSSTETVTTYTLSGTLAVGTSTITVAYGGKTTTFNVTVTEVPITPVLYRQSVESGGTTGWYAKFYTASANYFGFWAEVKPNTDYLVTVTGIHFNRFRVQMNNTFDPDNITYGSADPTIYPLDQIYSAPTQPSDKATEQTVSTTVNSGNYNWMSVQVRSNISSTDELICTIEEV